MSQSTHPLMPQPAARLDGVWWLQVASSERIGLARLRRRPRGDDIDQRHDNDNHPHQTAHLSLTVGDENVNHGADDTHQADCPGYGNQQILQYRPDHSHPPLLASVDYRVGCGFLQGPVEELVT